MFAPSSSFPGYDTDTVDDDDDPDAVSSYMILFLNEVFTFILFLHIFSRVAPDIYHFLFTDI